MYKKIKEFGNGSIFSVYKIIEINDVKLSDNHRKKKLFIKVHENEEGITMIPMLNTINYNEKNIYKDPRTAEAAAPA